jgi:hypothetical protein
MIVTHIFITGIPFLFGHASAACSSERQYSNINTVHSYPDTNNWKSVFVRYIYIYTDYVTRFTPQLQFLVKDNIVISTYCIVIQILITGNPFLFGIFILNSINAVCRVMPSFHLHYTGHKISLRMTQHQLVR